MSMTERTKMYWMGEDVDQLPRERLLEIIRQLGQQLDSHRAATRSIIAFNNLARARARDFT